MTTKRIVVEALKQGIHSLYAIMNNHTANVKMFVARKSRRGYWDFICCLL